MNFARVVRPTGPRWQSATLSCEIEDDAIALPRAESPVTPESSFSHGSPNGTIINPWNYKAVGIWNAELQKIEFNEEEDAKMHEEEKAKQ